MPPKSLAESLVWEATGVDPAIGVSGMLAMARVRVRSPFRPRAEQRPLVLLRRSLLQIGRSESLLQWARRVAKQLSDEFGPPYVIEMPFLGMSPDDLVRSVGFVYALAALLGEENISFVTPLQAKAAMGRKKPKGVPYKDRKNYIVQAVREDTEGVEFLETETKARREATCDAIAIARAGCILYADTNPQFGGRVLEEALGSPGGADGEAPRPSRRRVVQRT
jgi:hypothetical protein